MKWLDVIGVILLVGVPSAVPIIWWWRMEHKCIRDLDTWRKSRQEFGGAK